MTKGSWLKAIWNQRGVCLVKPGMSLPLCVSVSHYLTHRLSAGSLGEQVGHEICICLWLFQSVASDTCKYIYQRTHTLSPGGVATLLKFMCNPFACARDSYECMLTHFAWEVPEHQVSNSKDISTAAIIICSYFRNVAQFSHSVSPSYNSAWYFAV